MSCDCWCVGIVETVQNSKIIICEFFVMEKLKWGGGGRFGGGKSVDEEGGGG
jgi:hypothetical protein